MLCLLFIVIIIEVVFFLVGLSLPECKVSGRDVRQGHHSSPGIVLQVCDNIDDDDYEADDDEDEDDDDN